MLSVPAGHLYGLRIVNSGCAEEVWIVPCGPRQDKPHLRLAGRGGGTDGRDFFGWGTMVDDSYTI